MLTSRLIKDKVYNILPYWLLGFLDYLIQMKMSHEYDMIKRDNSDSLLVIFMIDGKVKHGGLTDRLNGIISTYFCCKQQQLSFRIFFTKPFRLEDYLVPNKYDWTMSSDEISNFRKSCSPIFVRNPDTGSIDQKLITLYKKIRKTKTKNAHVYSNVNGVESGIFSDLFKELFKPSLRLQELLDEQKKLIEENYIAATFRFQQLLGDFKEDEYKTYNKQDQKSLIEECIKYLVRIYSENRQKILVTSDSITFLAAASKLDFVYVIPGEVVHMQFSSEDAFLPHAKAFLDLFMLSEASKIYSIKIKDMYDSGFPKLASRINNRPFVLLT